MTIYFFNIIEGNEYISDLEGIDCSDLAAVQKAAIAGASGLIAEAVKKGEQDYRGRFEVADERGATVLSLAFACPITIKIIPPLAKES